MLVAGSPAGWRLFRSRASCAGDLGTHRASHRYALVGGYRSPVAWGRGAVRSAWGVASSRLHRRA
jgi:hypothetical protein